MADRTAIVLAGGDPASADIRDHLPPGAVVIAADSGLAQAEALGLDVDVVVGDFDSVDPAALQAAVGAGAVAERHPVAKDHTDLELALLAARARGANRVVVVGGHGGRLDHFLANALLLAAPSYADLKVEAYVGTGRIVVLHAGGNAEVVGQPGDLCSLLAIGGPAHGVRTVGLRYGLQDEPLHPGSTRGMSNELVDTHARVTLASGTLLVIQPEIGRSCPCGA